MCVLSICLSGSCAARAGPAIGQFEIKTLGVDVGRWEFQSQNAFALGVPRRLTQADIDGVLIADDNSITAQRYGLELEYGIAPFLKSRVGIEFEGERLDDPRTPAEAGAFEALKLDEYALEAIWVIVPRRERGLALGVIVEYEHPAESGGVHTLSAGPIVEWMEGAWRATFNPVLVQFFGGETDERGRRDEKIDVGYSARALYRWSETVSLAGEAYGTIERLGATGSPDEAALLYGDFNQHRAGPVAYWSTHAGASEVTVGTGILFGLTENTPAATLKLSLEATF